MYKTTFKPILGFIFALAGFLLISPVFILITAVLFFANHGQPFFVQDRPGKNGESFKIIKFKTMNDNRDAFGYLLPETRRITVLGHFLRKTSLDEIPQLINVLKGDMCLVGPRPLLPEYMPLYNAFQHKRHLVKPGITGWAQVNGRNAISWQKKFELDVYYVENADFWLDAKILSLTIKKVFSFKGIDLDMGHFRGNKEKQTINVYGAGGHAKVIVESILSANQYAVGNVFDDDDSKEKLLGNYRVFSPKKIGLLLKDPVVIAVGSNSVRRSIANNNNFSTAPNIVHQTAVVSASASIGLGTVVLANVSVNAEAQIGKHCIINTRAIVEHDCIIDDFVHISPNVSLGGNVSVGEGTQVGIGATVIQGIKIGKWCTIGAGAVIIEDVPDHSVVVGVPGKIIKTGYERNLEIV